jgi:hypothetical protein
MRRWPALAAGAALAAAPGSAAGQDPSWADRIDLRGIAETETAVETEGGDLQKIELIVSPEATVDLGEIGRLTGIARLRLDPADDLEPGRPDQDEFRSSVSRRALIGQPTDLELRELYLDSFVGEAFLRLGKQQIVWGQADGLRVLDVVNPFDFREFILPEFQDRRIPLWAANAEIPVGPVTAQLVWLPDHTYDDIPDADAAFAFTSPLVVPQPPPSLAGGGPVIVAEADRPDGFVTDDDYGVRLTGFFGGWDLSLNYLYHFRDERIFFREALPEGGVIFRPGFERSHLVGGSASNAFGDFTLRAELGYSTDRFFIANDPGDADGVFETDEFGYVLGLDWQPDSDTVVSGQVFQSVIERPPAGAARDRVDTTATVRVEREFLNDTLTATGFLIQSANDGDGVLQLDLEYELRANLVLTGGADIFYGTDRGLFGEFRDRSRLTFGVELGF